ncbi:MAG: hypothetical protein L6437_02590, partial [Kiritimatiellae bacterium]|nr:hypothetical protein [Kiritimatiellia bacterium]
AKTWKTNTAEAQDKHPSHWMALPLPPNPQVSGSTPGGRIIMNTKAVRFRRPRRKRSNRK